MMRLSQYRWWCHGDWDLSFLQALVAEQESKDSGGAAVAEQVLSIMEIILDESNAEPLSEDKVSVWCWLAHSGKCWL